MEKPLPQSRGTVALLVGGKSGQLVRKSPTLPQSARTAALLAEAVNTLSWVHRMATVEDVTGHQIVVQVLAGAKRQTLLRKSQKQSI